MMNLKNKDIIELIRKNNGSFLRTKMYPEDFLRELAKDLISKQESCEIAQYLIRHMSASPYNKNFDWNTGSILQHFNPKMVIGEFERISDKHHLYGSIGISWVLGEYKIKHSEVIRFLYDVIEKTDNSEAWWRAAFSLEKLEIEDAVNILKRNLRKKKVRPLESCLKSISDKRSVIGILIHSDNKTIEEKIYPRIKKILLNSKNTLELINCCWIIGRLRLIDNDIFDKMTLLIKHNNYELKYYIFFSLQENIINSFRPLMEKNLRNKDPLIRKMAVRGLSQIIDDASLGMLKKLLYDEKNELVISEITKAIYAQSSTDLKKVFKIEHQANENGSIIDESDKWYADPSIYNTFSESEDPENICFDLVCQKIKRDRLRIVNPIDLATGTGRMLDQIIQKLQYDGTLCGVDLNVKMCEFLNKKFKRQKIYVNKAKIINSSIRDAPRFMKSKSSFVISSFGFPSKISDRKNCIEELKSVYKLLKDDGVFVTIGWDETFNDELNMMWFKYIPDSINADNFEEWRSRRSAGISSPRNCGLSWLKKGLSVPLEFSNLKESVFVMSHLFGRDAAEDIIRNSKKAWNMSLGITYNTKDEIRKIIWRLKNARD